MATLAFEINPRNELQVIAALKLFKGVKNVRQVARVEEIADDDECPICKANNYTLRPDVEAEILKAIEEDDFTHCEDFEDFKKKVLS